MKPPTLIENDSALRQACARWSELDVIGIDTEFVRERTFYPLPALIQVAESDRVSLVDVPALNATEILGEVLRGMAPLKVMHAYGEDIEVLAIAAGSEPEGVFDTQLAGAFAGYGFSLGYRALVEALLGIALDKGQTRSDWMRRPLSQAQLRYAALDAAYLLPMHAILAGELDALGRSAWYGEELLHQRRARERDREVASVYLRVKDRQRLTPPDHALLRSLAEWREREAMRRNMPRRHVLADSVLVAMAQSRPRSAETIAAVDGMPKRVAARYAEDLVALIAAAEGQPIAEADAPPDLRPHAGTLRRLKRRVKCTAEALNLPPELIANRRALEALLCGVLAEGEAGVPPEFLGWRDLIITRSLLECIYESNS